MFVGPEDTAFRCDFWSRGVIYYMWTYLDAICQLKQIKSETIVLLLPLIKSQTKTNQISKLPVFWDFCHNLSAFCSRFGKRSLTALIFLWRTAQHTASRRRASYKKVPQVAKLVGISMLTSRWTNIWTKRERVIYIYLDDVRWDEHKPSKPTYRCTRTHTHTYLDPLFLVKHQHVGAVQQPSLPVGIGAQEGGGLFWSQWPHLFPSYMASIPIISGFNDVMMILIWSLWILMDDLMVIIISNGWCSNNSWI